MNVVVLGAGLLGVTSPLAKLSTEGMRDEYARLAKDPGSPAGKEGNAQQAFSKAAKQLQAEYEVPFLAHACMEPLNCLVDLHEIVVIFGPAPRCRRWIEMRQPAWPGSNQSKLKFIHPF